MEAVDPRWRTASYSDNGGNCVEVGDDAGRVLVRDTKDRRGLVLRFTPGAWRRFADHVKCSLAVPQLGLQVHLGGGVPLRRIEPPGSRPDPQRTSPFYGRYVLRA